MKGDKYLAKIDGLMVKNRLLVIGLAMMLVFNAMNWFSMMSVQAKTQTVIVPIGSEGMQIGNGKADERYLRRMARYIVNQIGTYSAGSARQQFQEILQLFPPDSVTGAAKYFDGLAADIERYPSIASNTVWTGTEPLKYTSQLIQVQALKERIVNGTVVDRKQVYYCLKYRIDDTRFYLENITEKGDAGVDLCMLDDAPVKTADASE